MAHAETSDYLIVGGGMSADAAAKGIREQDPHGSITIVGEEPTAPFPRPALSKKLWTDPDFTFADAELDTAGSTGARLLLDTRVTAIDPAARTVTTSAGQELGYGRLLLATGGTPRRVDGLEPGPRVLYYRTLSDYHRLRELVRDGLRVGVVGGGWIGTEIAAAMAQQGCAVTLVHPDDVLGASMLPPALAARLDGWFADAGVALRPGRKVVGGHGDDTGAVLELDDGDRLEVDVAVVGLGVEPTSALARDAGAALADDGGIVVDSGLRTSLPEVYAAGDVATYPDRILGRTRVEHVDNATTMGTVAGRVLAGSEETYDHTPYFYSVLFGHRFEAVGTLDASLPTVEDHLDDERSVVHYLDESGRAVVGVLLWGVEDARDAARAVLAEQPLARGGAPDSLVGRIS